MRIGKRFQFSVLATLVTLLIQPTRLKNGFSNDSILNYDLVVKSFGSQDVFADECCRSNAFKLHTTMIVQTLKFNSFS